jgi:hypothetical protein
LVFSDEVGEERVAVCGVGTKSDEVTYQSDDLHEAPKGEEDSEEHLDGLVACARRGLRLLMRLQRGWVEVDVEVDMRPG